MKNILSILILLIFSTTFLHSQEAFLFEEYEPNKDYNFYELQDAFNNYWEGRVVNHQTPKHERGGWMQYRRWEWFWEQRVFPDGVFPNAMQLLLEKQKWDNSRNTKKKNQIQTGTNEWSIIGPISASGGYTGIGRLNAVVEDPNDSDIIWAGAASGGLWQSTDAGDTWTTNTDDLPVLGISDIIIDSNDTDIMYIATGDGNARDTYSVGVLKSTNGGTTWNTTGLNWEVTNLRTIKRLLIDPDDSNILYAATSNGIYKTTNAGTNWTQLTISLNRSSGFWDIEFHPTNSSILYASTNWEIVKTTNSGSSWSVITSGLPAYNAITYRIELAVSADEPDWVYALYGYRNESNWNDPKNHGFYGVYRSTNSGTNWSKRFDYNDGKNLMGWSSAGTDNGGQAWYDLSIAVNPNNADEVYTGGVNIWKSTNGGTSWNINTMWYSSGSIPVVHADQHHLYYSPYSSRLYSANDGGLDYTTNGGSSWTFIGSGLAVTQIYRLGQSALDSDLTLIGTQDNGTFRRNPSWTYPIGGDGMECIIGHTNENLMFGSLYYGAIRKSTNKGNSFTAITTPSENGAWVTPYVMDVDDQNTLYAGYQNVWKTTNQGTNWTKISTFANSGSPSLTVLHVAPSNNNYIYAGRGNSLWRTTNGGTNWSSVSLPTTRTITYMAIHPDEPLTVWATFSGYTSGQKVYYSTNGGTNWTNISGDLPNLPVNTIVHQKDFNNRVYIGTDIGVYYIDDNLTEWQAFNDGLPNVIINELEIYYEDFKLRAATYGRGLWEATIDNEPPTPEFSTVEITENNTYFDIKFNTPVWGNSDADTPINLSSFNFSFVQNGGNAYGFKANSITNTNGNALVGGENIVRINITVYGFPSGDESIVIKPANAESIYNSNSVAMPSNEEITIILNDTQYFIHINEDFEDAILPTNWSQSYISGEVDWQFDADGGNSSNPPSAYQGDYNALFYDTEEDGNQTRLITSSINFTEYGDNPLLTFWHAQSADSANQDELRIYYRTGALESWNLLETYTSNVTQWTYRSLSLPNISDDYQIAFEGKAFNGFGVAIDKIMIAAQISLLEYCSASTVYQWEYINRVRISDLSNTTNWQSGVGDYTNQIVSLNKGTTYNILVDVGSYDNGDQVRAWFDWNRNEEFEADEVCILTNPDNNGYFTGSFQVPYTATNMNIRMRIRLTWDTTPQPCGESNYGEIEDYTISISDDGCLPVAYYTNKFGSTGTNNGQLSTPYGIAVNSEGHIFVVDAGNSRVQKFNASGEYISKWGSAGSGNSQFTNPRGIAIDKNDNVYVADWGNHRIQIFDKNGTYIDKFGTFGTGNGQFKNPYDLDFDSDGNIYVVEDYNHRIQVFSSNLSYLRKWGAEGSNDGQFNRPTGIALDEDENVYVTERNNYRVQVFSNTGTFIRKWGTQGSDESQFNTPGGIHIDLNKVYIADWDNHRVQVFDKNGNFLNQFGHQSSLNGNFNTVVDLYVHYGKILTSEWTGNRIQIFESNPCHFYLSQPLNEEEDVLINPQFSWMAHEQVDSYLFELSEYENFSVIYDDLITSNNSFQLADALEYNSTYYWRISGEHESGDELSSYVHKFSTAPPVPQAPTLASPANNAENQALALTLDWNESEFATSYDIQLADNINFNSPFLNQNIAETEKAVSGLANAKTYYWKVRAKNISGTSDWSEIRSFTTVPPIPQAPELQSPANNAENQPLALTLEWNESQYATSYDIQLADNTNFNTPLVDENLTGTEKAVSGLSQATTYYWRARAKNSSGTSDWSAIRSFTTVPPAPAIPTLASPTNEAENQPLALTLEWNEAQYSTSYQIQLSNSINFISLLVNENLSELDYYATDLDQATTYYWRVRAKNVSGTSDWSAVRSFSTVPPIPAVPTLASPANNAENQALALTLEWNESEYATSYDIQLADNSNLNLPIVNDELTDTEKAVSGLSSATIYYWRARAKNISGTSDWSAVRSFTTVPPIPAVPTLASPVNNAENQPLAFTLDWNAVQYATSYDIQLADNNNFNSPIVDDEITDTEKAVTGLAQATTYYWRARAKNISGASDWSAVRSFTTVPPIPTAPTLASPANEAQNQPLDLTLEWNESQYATTYQVQVSKSINFISLFINENLSELDYYATNLETGTTYYWRVRAKNISGTSDWSTVRSFTTVPPIPAVPTLASPANTAENQPLALTLEWNESEYATSYDIQLTDNSNFTSPIVNDEVTDTEKAVSGLSQATTYYWRARAKNISGTSEWSVVRSFTTVPPIPVAPTLASPANTAENQPLALTLDWNEVQFATSYDIQLADNSNFNLPIINDEVTDTEKAVTGLSQATTYYWRARAKNISGTSDWSTVRSFNTVPPIPVAPTLASPANTAENQPLALTLEWNDVQYATSYDIQLADNSNFNMPIINDEVTDIEKAVSGLAQATTYYWKARAKNISGTSNWSAVRNFTTVPPIPVAPTLASPANTAENQPLALTLEWNDVQYAASYDIQLSDNSNFTSPIVNDEVTNSEKAVSGLATATTYYWKARAKNISGTSDWSEIRTFTTLPPIPVAPTLASPANNAENQAIALTLEWNDVQYATSYDIILADNSNFNLPIVNDEVIDTEKAVSGLAQATTYYWRARAKNISGTSDWSAVRSFTTVPPIPVAPTLASPANNSENQPLALTLDWNDVQYATSYDIQLADNSNFNMPIINDEVTDIEKAVSGLAQATTYYWKARAKNISGTSEWSAVRSFTTVPPIPAVPTLASPANNAENQPLALTLEWNDVQYATSYDIQLSDNSNFTSPIVNDEVTNSEKAVSGLATATTYYWKARAKNISGTSNWSAVRNFTTVPPIPVAPTLASPANTAENQPLALTLEWNESEYATSYDIQLADNSYFTSPIVDDNISDSEKAVSGLAQATTYYWRARAKNISGTSDWSAVRSFTTVPPIPVAPTLASPANNSENQLLALTLQWNDVQYATSYDIILADNSNFNLPIVNDEVTDTEKAVSGLCPNTTFYWRARAKNVSGTSDWSNTYNFKTFEPFLECPELISPINNSINQQLTLTFNWNSVTDAEEYRLQLATSDDFNATIVNELTEDIEIDVNNLSNYTTYFWRVQAINEFGTSQWSTVWNFKTLPPIPQAPVLVSPSDDAVDLENTLTFSWETTEYASTYDLQVSNDEDFLDLILDVNTTNVEYELNDLEYESEYFWRVRTNNISGNSPWSQVLSFTVKSEIQIVSLEIGLTTGWNLISGYVSVEENDIEQVFNEILDDIVIVKEGNRIFIPNQLDNIHTWDYNRAYRVFVSSSVNLVLEGELIKPEEEVLNIPSGWSTIPYLRSSNILAKDAFNSIVTKIVIVKGPSGEVYIPGLLENMILSPTKGYSIFLSEPTEFSYPAND